MAKFTKNQVSGFFKADKIRPEDMGLSGTCFNDAYNLEHYGITNAEYHEMRNFLENSFGLCRLSTAEKRKVLQSAK